MREKCRQSWPLLAYIFSCLYRAALPKYTHKSYFTKGWKINRLYTYETINVDGVFKEVRGFVPEDFVFKEFK